MITTVNIAGKNEHNNRKISEHGMKRGKMGS